MEGEEVKSNEARYHGRDFNQKKNDNEQTNLYIESKERSINSCLRQDDFDVFLRVKTYHNKITRQAKKLVQFIKWLPYSKKFPIWKDSRKMIFQLREKQASKRREMYYRVAEDIKKKVEKIRPGDEKATAAVMARYTFHIKD